MAQDGWIARVLGLSPVAGGDPAAETAALQEAVDSLIGTVSDDLLALREDAPQQAPAIAAALRQAMAQGDSGDLAGAFRSLDAITDRLAALRRAARADAADAAIPQGAVAAATASLERARGRWDGALAEAQGAARQIMAELRATSPDHADGLDSVIQSYWDDVDALFAAAGGEDMAGLRGGIEALRREMAADPLLDALESEGYGVRAAFVAALADLLALLVDAPVLAGDGA